MPTMTKNNTSRTIHANISSEMKQSVREWCRRNDLTESQLLRRAIQVILSDKASGQ